MAVDYDLHSRTRATPYADETNFSPIDDDKAPSAKGGIVVAHACHFRQATAESAVLIAPLPRGAPPPSTSITLTSQL